MLNDVFPLFHLHEISIFHLLPINTEFIISYQTFDFHDPEVIKMTTLKPTGVSYFFHTTNNNMDGVVINGMKKIGNKRPCKA